MSNPFRYFNSSPQVIRLVVLIYVRYPLSLPNLEDRLMTDDPVFGCGDALIKLGRG